jgi:threonine dehydrogenase-like Zn-dependent dehydrogenase
LVDPPLACAARKIDPPCPACREGKPSTCWNFDRGSLPPALGIGYNNFTGGSWSPYFVAHKSQIHLLPDEIPDEQAILIDPIACSLHAVLQDPPAAHEKILIFGAGIIGLGIVMALRALNLPVDITALVRRQSQADLAMQCGANHTVLWTPDRISSAVQQMAEITDARGFDIFYKMRFLQGGFDRLYDCTGNIAALAESQRLLRSGGKLILAGTPQLGLADLTCFWFRELKVQGVTGRAIEPLPSTNNTPQEPKHDYRHVIDMIQQNRLKNLSLFNVKLYPQQNYRQALTDLQGKSRSGVHKAAFDFRRSSE